MLNTIITTLDPQTYGFNRSAVAIGLVALGMMITIGSKLMSVLHAAGLPSVGS